ncbi:RNA-dependent RNA polymerase 1 [Caerostris extrusa]|uniref:RNA-dependent RNA polymerase n=1 Tax=Caerostris extrusa TaxID=172846 RepID=A0AAV4UCV7_CAEEX|nr:RNA-dependent RNA polymerase 1 [Caerostris extrusa]
MGGSDLDGDEYSVLWDDDLIFHRNNERPAHFPSPAQETSLYIRDADMINFLVQYIKNDQVGAIANAHLAHADRQDIFSNICIKIANKFSFAVDYAKTGVSRHLEPNERPTCFPDFMERNYKETYNSKKALGKMFRVAHDYESENKEASITYQDIQMDPDLKFDGWELYKENALKSRNKYNALLKTLLRNYGIQHEAEVFSGAFTNLHCRFQERKDKDEIEKVVVRCMKRLAKNMYEEFLEEFKNFGNVKEMDVRILQKASAWYVVTYSDNNAKFLSFPWTVSKFLANIKLRKTGNQPVLFSPIVVKMDEQIKMHESNNILPHPIHSSLWQDYNYICDSRTVQLAFRVLLLWARDEELLDIYHGIIMDFNVFLRLFLHVAESANYIVSKMNPVSSNERKFSAASLCLEFFSFCLKLRFYNPKEIKEMISFPVHNYNKLSKRAVVAYHKFALLGKFNNLYADDYEEERGIQMKPIYIESKIFPYVPIYVASLQKAEDALRKHSKAEDVSLREIRQTKKVVVSAVGTEQSLKVLKSFLRKKHVWLKELFTTGNLPAE